MMVSANIGSRGEGYINDWLTQNGYRTNWNTRGSGATDIEAWGREHALIQVKSAVFPNTPAFPPTQELALLRARARRLNANWYVAQVAFKPTGQPSVYWSKNP